MAKNKFKRGTYTHFKGNSYTVYATATDLDSNIYVLYRQNYGNKSFWIRPYKDFFGKVPEKENTKRFSLSTEIDIKQLYNDLEKTIRNTPFIMKHSETEEAYLIFSVPNDYDEPIKICKISDIESIQSSYLTDFQIAIRMGHYLLNFRGKKIITTSPIMQDEKKKLIIYDNDKPIHNIEDYLTNPCSVDMHIAEDFFCKTTHKKIDLLSMLRYHNTSSKLWKEIKPKTRNNTQQITIHPGQTIITHTFEKISLPTDCAAKIEIKSTYARLSLSITTSDFCNPGWEGYFPLVIHNKGKHKIVIHPKEKMLQLILVPTKAPIISEYSNNSSFMNDSGKPYPFWQSRTAKQFRKKHKLDEITEFYEKVIKSINKENCSDVEGCQKRFADTFLLFCEKKLRKSKYKKINNKNKVEELWKSYKESEQTKKRVSSIRFGMIFLSILPSIIPIGYELIKNGALSINSTIIICSITSIILILLSIFWLIKFPKVFCTFEQLEYKEIIKADN